MSGYYSFNIADDSLKKEISSTQFNFTHKSELNRVVNNADGIITVDLSDFATVTALMVTTTLAISLVVNGVAVLVENFLFTELTDLTSLTVACSDATGSTVKIIAWGT